MLAWILVIYCCITTSFKTWQPRQTSIFSCNFWELTAGSNSSGRFWPGSRVCGQDDRALTTSLWVRCGEAGLWSKVRERLAHLCYSQLSGENTGCYSGPVGGRTGHRSEEEELEAVPFPRVSQGRNGQGRASRFLTGQRRPWAKAACVLMQRERRWRPPLASVNRTEQKVKCESEVLKLFFTYLLFISHFLAT